MPQGFSYEEDIVDVFLSSRPKKLEKVHLSHLGVSTAPYRYFY